MLYVFLSGKTFFEKNLKKVWIYSQFKVIFAL